MIMTKEMRVTGNVCEYAREYDQERERGGEGERERERGVKCRADV